MTPRTYWIGWAIMAVGYLASLGLACGYLGSKLNAIITIGVALAIRGSASTFSAFDVSPSWEAYTAPVAHAWRYVQVKAGVPLLK